MFGCCYWGCCWFMKPNAFCCCWAGACGCAGWVGPESKSKRLFPPAPALALALWFGVAADVLAVWFYCGGATGAVVPWKVLEAFGALKRPPAAAGLLTATDATSTVFDSPSFFYLSYSFFFAAFSSFFLSFSFFLLTSESSLSASESRLLVESSSEASSFAVFLSSFFFSLTTGLVSVAYYLVYGS